MTDNFSLSRTRAGKLQPDLLPRSLAAGVLAFLLQVVLVVSFTALIFSGPLAPSLPYGIGLLVAGDAVLTAVVTLLSSYAGSIAVEQDVPSAVLAVAATALLASLPRMTSPAQQFSTIVVMIAGTTLGTGLFLTLLGALKLGRLVRFLPYPVMGGFLAGTGYLLTMGGLGVMLNSGTSLQMFMPDQWMRWVPGLVLGAVMLFATERFKHPLTLPVTFALAFAGFYLLAVLTRTNLAQLSSGGWLLGPFPAGSLWQFPFSPAMLSQVNWAALVSQWPNLATVPLVSVVALLLNASGIELVVKRDIDLDRELFAAGAGNLAGGLVGGTVGYHAISLSTLSYAVSGGRRLPGILVALLMGVIAVSGASLFGYLPRMVLAALLVYLGLGLLVEWIYRAWFRFPRIDFAILLAILVVIAVRGFLEGVGIGLILAVSLFLVSYSRIPVARYALSGKTYRSRVQRSPQEQQVLDRHSDELYVLKLHGFIFFGTADRLFEQIRERTRQARLSPLRFVVLDFALVSGLDSTALLSFEKLLRLVKQQEMTLVMAGLQGRTREQFAKGEFRAPPQVLQFFTDLDRAVEWCENQLTVGLQFVTPTETTLRDELGAILLDHAGVQKLIGYMERMEVAAGEYLIRQGDEADALYFVESGRVTAQLEAPGQKPVRLETTCHGRSVGEIGFYLDIPRTAAVVADEQSVVYRLPRQKLEHIEKTDPEAAYALHRIIVHVLVQRVRHLTNVVDALEH